MTALPQPTLLGRCAAASSARETAFRIDRPNSAPRSSCIVALDGVAADAARRLEDRGGWDGAHFMAVRTGGDDGTLGLSATADDRPLASPLDGADLVVMLASPQIDREAAAQVGSACAAGGLMTAGFVLGEGPGSQAALAALRPHAMVLLVVADDDELADVLTALRA